MNRMRYAIGPPSLQLLLDDTENDIVCVQETWYTKQDLEHLNNLHPAGTGAATNGNIDCLYHGQPPGGVSILWRVEFDRVITPIKFDLDWLTGIMFEQDGRKYAIISVYIPYECNANEDIYLEKLGVLHSILDELDTTCVSILGDWNGDTSDPNSQFARHFKLFCLDTWLVLSDEILFPSNTFTQMSERWHTTAWLDHCLSSGDGHTVIEDMAVLYSTCCSDHIPIV